MLPIYADPVRLTNNYTGNLVVVRCACGSHGNGETGMSQEVYGELCQKGAYIVTAGHALSGCERGVAKKYSGGYHLIPREYVPLGIY